jgi:hypothetical protein
MQCERLIQSPRPRGQGSTAGRPGPAPWVPVVEDTIIVVIDEPVLVDTERLASVEARILLFLLTGRRSSEEISAKLSAEESNGEAFIRKITVRNQQG